MVENFLLLLENPVALLDLALQGLLVGAVFALIAYGMALVWGVMNIINITQGEFVILGGFVAFYFSEWGISPLFAVPMAGLILYVIASGLYLTPVHGLVFANRLRPWLLAAGVFVASVAGFLVSGASLVPAVKEGVANWGSVAPAVAIAVDSLLVTIPVMFVVGGGLYTTVLRHIVGRDLFTSILATFGISIFLQQFMNEALTADVEVANHGLGTWSFVGGDITIEQIRLVALVFALLIGVLLAIYMRKSRSGQAIRATAQNPRAARIMGIDTDRVYARTYALNAAICGSAGALVAMIWAVQAYGGLVYTLRAFMVVIFAGLGNLVGVIVAGLGLGVAENLAGFILGLEFQIAFVFGLLVVVLIYRRIRLSFARKVLS